MAFVVGELAAPLSIDQKDFEKGLDEAKKKGNSFSSQWASDLNGLGSAMAETGANLNRNVTLPILGLGTAVVAVASNFESSMNRVQALTNASGSEFKSLQNQAKELGATTQYSASQAADAMGFLGMAGFNTNQILGAMPGTLQLAASAQMDLAQAADITSNILTGYGKDVSELGKVNDVLVKAFTSANMDLTQLGIAMKYAGPVASGMGYQFEEAAAAIGLMGNAGIQGSMAGTALRGSLSRLANPSKQAAAALDRLKVSAKDGKGNMLPLVDIISQLEKSGATAADMLLIFGDRAGPAMQALVDQGSESLRTFTRELESSSGTAQRIADTQMRGARGAFLEMQSAGEAVLIAIAESGILEHVTSIARGFAQWLQTMSQVNPEVLRMGTNVAIGAAALGPMLSLTGKLTTGLTGIYTTGGKVVAAFKAVGTASTAAGAGATVAGSKLAALAVSGGPILLATAAIVGLGYATYKLNKTMREEMKSIETKVEESFSNVAKTAARETGKMASETLSRFDSMRQGITGELLKMQIGSIEISEETYQGIINQAENMRRESLLEIEQYRIEALSRLQEYFNTSEGLSDEWMASETAVIEDHYKERAKAIEGAYDEVVHLIETAMAEGRRVTVEEWNAINEIIKQATGNIIDSNRLMEAQLLMTKDRLKDATVKKTKDEAKAIHDIIEDSYAEQVRLAEQGLQEKLQAIQLAYARGEIRDAVELQRAIDVEKRKHEEILKEAHKGYVGLAKEHEWAYTQLGLTWDEYSQNYVSKWTAFGIKVADMFGVQWKQTAEEAYENARQAGRNTGKGLSDGLDDSQAMVRAAANRLAGAVNQAVQTTLDIHSPSRVAVGWGKYVVQGFVGGLDSGKQLLQRAAQTMAELISPDLALPLPGGGQVIDVWLHHDVRLKGVPEGMPYQDLKRAVLQLLGSPEARRISDHNNFRNMQEFRRPRGR